MLLQTEYWLVTFTIQALSISYHQTTLEARIPYLVATSNSSSYLEATQ